MSNRFSLSIGIIVPLLASACSSEQQNPGADRQLEAKPTASASATAASPIPGSSATAAAEGALSKYVGKHPSEQVDGTRFLDEASVRKAVAANVTDAAVRKFVFDYDGPDAPIVAKAGRILAWGCERHNCGYHNWSIAIAPDGTDAEVCYYHDNDRPDGTSTWYLPGGKSEQRPGNCPSE